MSSRASNPRSPTEGYQKHVLQRPSLIDEGDCFLRNLGSKIEGFAHEPDNVVFYDFSIREAVEEDEDDGHTTPAQGQEHEEDSLLAQRQTQERDLISGDNQDEDDCYGTFKLIPIGDFYPLGSRTEMKSSFFSHEEEPLELRIMEFPACRHAESFLKAIKEHPIRSKAPLDSVLHSRNFKLSKLHNSIFKTGVSFRAVRGYVDLQQKQRIPESIILFTSIPYFGKPPMVKYPVKPITLSKPAAGTAKLTEDLWSYKSSTLSVESLSLSEYRFPGLYSSFSDREDERRNLFEREAGGESPEGAEADISVHQAWLVVLDNQKMAIFKSEDDMRFDHNQQPPLRPYQEIKGAFNALVHIMSNIFDRSERMLLDICYPKAALLEHEVEDLLDVIEITDETQKKLHKTTRKLSKTMSDICTMMRVVESQIQILRDLREIFSVSSRKKGERSVESILKIPVILKQKEQMPSTAKAIGVVIERREAFYATLDGLFKDVKRTHRSLFHLVQKDSAIQAEEKTREEMELQANSMSMFTLVTTLFLPLGFFASYAAMDPVKATIKTQGKFWAITGPITALFMLMTLWIVLHKKGERGIKRLKEGAKGWVVKLHQYIAGEGENPRGLHV